MPLKFHRAYAVPLKNNQRWKTVIIFLGRWTSTKGKLPVRQVSGVEDPDIWTFVDREVRLESAGERHIRFKINAVFLYGFAGSWTSDLFGQRWYIVRIVFPRRAALPHTLLDLGQVFLYSRRYRLLEACRGCFKSGSWSQWRGRHWQTAILVQAVIKKPK